MYLQCLISTSRPKVVTLYSSNPTQQLLHQVKWHYCTVFVCAAHNTSLKWNMWLKWYESINENNICMWISSLSLNVMRLTRLFDTQRKKTHVYTQDINMITQMMVGKQWVKSWGIRHVQMSRWSEHTGEKNEKLQGLWTVVHLAWKKGVCHGRAAFDITF